MDEKGALKVVERLLQEDGQEVETPVNHDFMNKHLQIIWDWCAKQPWIISTAIKREFYFPLTANSDFSDDQIDHLP